MLLQAGCDANLQWDLSEHLQDLNFYRHDEEETDVDKRTDAEKKYPYKSENEGDANELSDPVKEKDLDPASEHSLRQRVYAHMLAHAEFTKKYYGFYASRHDNPFHILTEIRRAAARISTRLREACVQFDEPSPQGRVCFNAMQAAVAMERHDIVALLAANGVILPPVLTVSEEQEGLEAERVARWLRMQHSLHHSNRGKDGTYVGGGSASLPN